MIDLDARWPSIDEALDEYQDATGEPFTPETCGQLVWFAVEWFAYSLANDIRYDREH